MCPHLNWVWVSSGCSQVSQKCQRSSLCPSKRGAEHLCDLRQLPLNTLSFWWLSSKTTVTEGVTVPGMWFEMLYSDVAVREGLLSVLSENKPLLQLDYTKNFQNYSQLLKILSILIIYFPLTTFIMCMWLQCICLFCSSERQCQLLSFPYY